MNRLDLKAEAWKTVQDLRTYRSIGGIEAQQQPVMLNTFTAQKQEAIMTLMTLQNMEYRFKRYGLSKFADLVRLGKDKDRQGRESNNNDGNRQYATIRYYKPGRQQWIIISSM